MDQPAYTAQFRDLELKIVTGNGTYLWTVARAGTVARAAEEVARGEAHELEGAMVAAAEAARADWGSVRWRGIEEDDE